MRFHISHKGACTSISVRWTADWAGLYKRFILDDRMQDQKTSHSYNAGAGKASLWRDWHTRRLHQMAHRLAWCWWRLIRWRTVFSGAGGSSSDGAKSCLVVVVLLYWVTDRDDFHLLRDVVLQYLHVEAIVPDARKVFTSHWVPLALSSSGALNIILEECFPPEIAYSWVIVGVLRAMQIPWSLCQDFQLQRNTLR